MSKSMIDELNILYEKGIDPLSCEQGFWDRFGKTRAVVVIDSSGFSKTTFKRGIIYTLSRLARKRAIIAPVLERFGCDVYVTEADSYIALFENICDAMDAVLQSVATIYESGLTMDANAPYKICAGIGYGTLLVTGGHGEFFGEEMNTASKLGEDTAEANQLLITEAAFQAFPEDRQKLFSKAQCSISGCAIDHYIMDLE